MKKMTKKQKRMILIGIIVVVVILGLLFLKSLFFVKQDRVYGNRLDGIEDVEVSESVMNEMASVFKDVEGVKSTDARENGKIIKSTKDLIIWNSYNLTSIYSNVSYMETSLWLRMVDDVRSRSSCTDIY